MTFDQWLDERESYCTRRERLHDDLQYHSCGRNVDIMKWLKTAYQEGYDQARYDTMKIYWDSKHHDSI